MTLAPDWTATINSPTNRVWCAVALSVGYVALYLAFDRLSIIEAQYGIGITPWNPTAGLTLALLIIKRGLRWSPVALAAELLSGATLPEVAISPLSILLAALLVTGGYAGAAVILRRMGFEASLRKTLDIVLFLVVTIASAGMVACGFVATYAISGIVPRGGFPDAVFHF